MATLVLAEFRTADALLDAVRALRERGVDGLDTHTPFPVEGTSEALGLRRSAVPAIVLAGGLLGAVSAYLLQWWTNAVDFPINVGGRPAHAAPSFIPITFELAILFGALGAFFGLLALFRFPALWHPAQDVDAFRTASTHGFWLSARLSEGIDELERACHELGATTVSRVEERER